jgi:hypothetical protein
MNYNPVSYLLSLDEGYWNGVTADDCAWYQIYPYPCTLVLLYELRPSTTQWIHDCATTFTFILPPLLQGLGMTRRGATRGRIMRRQKLPATFFDWESHPAWVIPARPEAANSPTQPSSEKSRKSSRKAMSRWFGKPTWIVRGHSGVIPRCYCNDNETHVIVIMMVIMLLQRWYPR